MTLFPFSQRDWRWRWKQLGSGPGTIGQYGCTITCLSMINRSDPWTTNKMLRAGGGFFNGTLVNWTLLHQCLARFQFLPHGRVYHYNDPTIDPTDNNAVKAHIATYGFCLVNVDAAPIGNPGGEHWVLFIGNQKCLDPWDGKVKPTSVFRAHGYCLVAYT